MKLIIFFRAVVAIVLFVILTAALATIGIVSNFLFNRRRFDNWVMKSWGRYAFKFFNIELKIFGSENLKNKQGAVILFNHSSFIDVLTLCYGLYNVRFGAKIELFKVPLLGLCMRRFGVLPIARDNREEVFRIYDEAKARFALGERFCLSPEGGRYHGKELLPFKAGPFIFAINSQVPLIPVVIKGAYDVWPKGQILANSTKWKSIVELHILPPVLTNGFEVLQRSQLQEITYKLMNDVYTSKT